MSSLSVSNIFTTGIIDADKFNTNYSDIVTYVNNRNSGSATWDAAYCTSSTNVPITASNSTGTQDIAQFNDNGTIVGEIFDGGIISFPYQDYAKSKTNGESYSSGPTIVSLGLVSQTHSSMSGSIFTAIAKGKYLVIVHVDATIRGFSPFIGTLFIYKNGAEYSRFAMPTTGSSAFDPLIIGDIVDLSVSDYIQFYYTPNSTDDLAGSASLTSFNVVKIS